MAVRSGQRLTPEWVTQVKKDLIESECQGLLDFIESTLTLDHLAGSDAVMVSSIDDEAPCSSPSPTVGSASSADSFDSTVSLELRGALTARLATFVPRPTIS